MTAWILVGGRLVVTPTPAPALSLLAKPDLVVAADGGARHAAVLGVKVDAWVGDKFTGIDLVKAQKGKLQQGDMLYAERIAMAVKKGNSSLLKELNAELAKAQSNGNYARISNGYFGQDIRCK